MDFINSIVLKLIEQDSYNQAYGMAGTVGEVFCYLTALWYTWRMRLHPLKTVAITFLGLNFATGLNGLLLFALSGFTNGVRSNLAVMFVYLLPLSWLLGKIFRLRWQTVSELIALTMLAFHVFGRSGCIFTGCCHGYHCDWGVYSLVADDTVFPVVLVESLMTLGIFIFLLIRMRGKDYVADGKAMPWMLTLYGVGRFLTEFLRDNEKIWLGCSDIAFHALFMAVVGLIALFCIDILAMHRKAKH